uniref:Uncharacterized protein n=1 Tax=Vibrio splendidus TaxID=29497 RepID=A0A0H4A0T3_VIBSP|nr:hypothetical protein [Vibrio splendidus]
MVLKSQRTLLPESPKMPPLKRWYFIWDIKKYGKLSDKM